MKGFYDELLGNIKAGDVRTFTREKWEPSTWPEVCEGVGMSEAPRGALAHWIRIKDKKIENYQLVVPSTWNASPRDVKGQRSAYEESLLGTPVANPEQPVEILRTIHSFDPCLACAVHQLHSVQKGTVPRDGRSVENGRASNQGSRLDLDWPQRAGGFALLSFVFGVLISSDNRIRSILEHERFVLPAVVRVDRAVDGWGLCGAPMAPRVHVVFRRVCDNSRLSCLLSRLR
jgi:hypothetical protein